MTTHDLYDICACALVRKTARVLTQRYDAALRPAGIKVTQFSILRALQRTPKAPLTTLAEQLALDRTGLTRNLKPLERDGLIRVKPGEDSRQRIVQLTNHGRGVLQQAETLWQGVQHEVIAGVGLSRIKDINTGLAELGQAAQIEHI
jgi:DNA-binding MarR family transcriptional regulator